jgi:hypothetical protein
MRTRSDGSSQILSSWTVRPSTSAREYPYRRSNAAFTSTNRPSTVPHFAMGTHDAESFIKLSGLSCFVCHTQREMSLAYTPGVAEPCMEIQKNPHNAFKYTASRHPRGCVERRHSGARAGEYRRVSRQTGHGREECIATTPTKLSKCASCSSPHSEGINLEDIRAPECFYIEETLKQTMHIPVFHDDQHGTAIISGAAVINASEIVDLDWYSKTGTGRLTPVCNSGWGRRADDW